MVKSRMVGNVECICRRCPLHKNIEYTDGTAQTRRKEVGCICEECPGHESSSPTESDDHNKTMQNRTFQISRDNTVLNKTFKAPHASNKTYLIHGDKTMNKTFKAAPAPNKTYLISGGKTMNQTYEVARESSASDDLPETESGDNSMNHWPDAESTRIDEDVAMDYQSESDEMPNKTFNISRNKSKLNQTFRSNTTQTQNVTFDIPRNTGRDKTFDISRDRSVFNDYSESHDDSGAKKMGRRNVYRPVYEGAKKRANKRRNTSSFIPYIRRMVQSNPDRLSISKRAVRDLNQLLVGVMQKISTEAGDMTGIVGRKTLLATDIGAASKLIMPPTMFETAEQCAHKALSNIRHTK